MHAKHVSRNGSPIPPHAQVLLCLLCTVFLRYPTLSLSTRAPLSSTSSLVSGSWTTLAVRPTAELPVDRQCKWTQCECECGCGCGCGCGCEYEYEYEYEYECENNVSARAAGKKAKDTNENVYHNLQQQERTHAHCASLSLSTIYNQFLTPPPRRRLPLAHTRETLETHLPFPDVYSPRGATLCAYDSSCDLEVPGSDATPGV